MSDPVAYRYRNAFAAEKDADTWGYASPESLPQDSRERMREKGWEIEPLTVLEEDDE